MIRRLSVAALVATLIALTWRQSAMAAPQTIAALNDPERTRVLGLLAQAEDLLSRAQQIAAATPRTRLGAAYIAAPGATGGRFYRDERRFQDQTRNGPNVFQIKSPALRSAELNLTTVDSFLYGAVLAAMNCNAHDATLNLRVARAFIAEIQRDVAGRGSSDWSPPEITEDGRVLCR